MPWPEGSQAVTKNSFPTSLISLYSFWGKSEWAAKSTANETRLEGRLEEGWKEGRKEEEQMRRAEKGQCTK
jgi:hypothetical protein